MKILVVENSSVICTRLRALLTQGGNYEALGCAECVSSALKLLDTCQPDAVLLDLHLNDGDGFRLLGLIREREPRLPVVMLSLNQGWQYQIAASARGADAFLCKSSQFEDIVPTLDRLLQAHGGAPALPRGACAR